MLKAYIVTEEDEGTGGVVFARSSAEARREGSQRFGDGDFNWGKARRAPGLDQYAADGRAPWKALFDMGWWCECSGCGCRIQQDEEDEEGSLIQFDLVEVGSSVYCRPSCREQRLAEDAEVARLSAWAIADLTDRVMRAMPGAVILGGNDRSIYPHVYVPRGAWPMAPKQIVLHFMFPGARFGGDVRVDKIGEKPKFLIVRGDLVAFHRWREAGYPPHLMDASEAA
jgi:hypothetical protein